MIASEVQQKGAWAAGNSGVVAAELCLPERSLFTGGAFRDGFAEAQIVRKTPGTPHLECICCARHLPISTCEPACGCADPNYSYLQTIYDYANVTFHSPRGTESAWSRFVELLPAKALPIHFNEMTTPLFTLPVFGRQIRLPHLWVKDESKNPTCSAKDRQSIVIANCALELGIEHLFIVSSGNAAVSLAKYAARAGMRCDCIVPQGLSPAKEHMIRMFGADVIKHGDKYEETYRWAREHHRHGWNCTPGVNPLGEEGLKLIGFEIFEAFGHVPDAIVVPCGNGSLLAQVFRAFEELQLMGLCSKLPRMIGVQVKNAAPIGAALRSGRDFAILEDIPASIAEGIIAEESYCSPKAVRALRRSGGQLIEVTDGEIEQALVKILETEKLLPEPTSAAAYAALPKLGLPPDSRVVVVQTADGRKDLEEIAEIWRKTTNPYSAAAR